MNENEVLQRIFAVLEQYFATRNEGVFVKYTSPADLQKLLALDEPGSEGDWDRTFKWIEQYLEYGVKTSHPSFMNRMWAGANMPSMMAEMVTALSNTSACTYESAPVSTLFERHMIQEMLDLVGFVDGEGQMTTGSSNANMIAMMCARNIAAQQVKQQGLFGQRELFGFVNGEAHYSMDKASNILGIGSDHLIKVEVNERGEMIAEKLEAEIEKVVRGGGVPFFVAATAGTTVRGAYDPIEPILALRDRYKFWLHVDGAWGGAAVMSDRLRGKYLPRLAEANSFTCDFHKMLGSSLMCNILLINRSEHIFGKVLAAGDGSYLFRDTDDTEVDDLGNVSLQCGRRVDSLKWFLDWKYYGKSGFAERIEKYLELCEYAEQRVQAIPELELVSERTSFNICFRFKAPENCSREQVNRLTEEIRTRIYKKGAALVGLAYIKEHLAMRLLVTNTNIGIAEIDSFLAEVVATGKDVLAFERGRTKVVRAFPAGHVAERGDTASQAQSEYRKVGSGN
ncbi:pyridoxal phosphate-dependent decarboxylase family protein [Desulfosediminicola sp.]|uniref:pyridoxal phosphate-dependent decarboxylase family protein n=1 Tax=Desulfosediminicola sp. TaxID=2886825 RepID=UPI003AF2F418